VVDITLTASSALTANVTIGENHIILRDDLALVSIATPLGGEAQLAKALKKGWGLDMPEARHLSVQDEIQAIQTAPDQMLLVFVHPTPDANAVVQARLNGAGYTTDQTDTYVVLGVSGPDTRSALERICPIDLHHDAFAIGDVARTSMDHLGTMIIRTGPDTFLMMSALSSAQSFLHVIETSFRAVV